MEKGKTFETVDEAVKFVTEYAAENFFPLRQRNCVTVASYNKKVSVSPCVTHNIGSIAVAVHFISFGSLYI